MSPTACAMPLRSCNASHLIQKRANCFSTVRHCYSVFRVSTKALVSPHPPLPLPLSQYDFENPPIRVSSPYFPRCHWCSRQGIHSVTVFPSLLMPIPSKMTITPSFISCFLLKSYPFACASWRPVRSSQKPLQFLLCKRFFSMKPA